MQLIGLNGRMRSGKDTAVEYIADYMSLISDGDSEPLVVERAGFADKLKMSAARALGFDPSSVDEAVTICGALKGGDVTSRDADGSFMRISGREFLQRYGTECHRDIFGQDFWVNALLPMRFISHDDGSRHLRAVDDLFPGFDVLCVTDVRFENEAKRIRALGGEVWYIEADQRLGPLPEGSHPSEHPLPPELIDRTVRNNRGLLDFQQAISFATVEMLTT